MAIKEWALVACAAVTMPCVPRAVLAHGEVMEVGSTANGSGQLTLSGFDFSQKIYVPPTFVGATQTLYSTIFPSFEFPAADRPGIPLYRLPNGTPLTLEIACDGSLCIDPGASVRTNVIADATGETCSLGTVSAGSHFHPEWRLILANGVFGEYRLPFRLTTAASGYGASQVYTLTLTNAPPTVSPTPTASPSATATPTPTGGPCSAEPIAGCSSLAGKSVLRIKRKAVKPERNRFTWKWLRGEVHRSDFGDPLADTAYTLCGYDEQNAVFVPVIDAVIPPGGTCDGDPCWSSTAVGFTFEDKTGAANGIRSVVLKSGASGKAKILVKGKGTLLGLGPLPLGQDPRVVIQLRSSNGFCWESTFGAPAAKNDMTTFADTD